jgi:hypothetical protein
MATLQSGFVKWESLIAAALLLFASCASRPWYALPEQRASMGEAELGALGHFVYMSQADADAYIVGGMREKSEGPWRWAQERPVLRFYLPEVGRLRFEMDLSFPEHEFKQTGPVTLTLTLNGTVFDRVRYDKAGQERYSHAVPAELARANAINMVAITPDKTAGRAEGGERLGFVLTSAGFAE